MTADAETERDWEWSFHAIGRFEADRQGRPVTLPPPAVPPVGVRPDVTDGRESWNWTRNIREAAHDGLWRAKWTTGRSVLSACQRVSSAGTLRTADADGLIGDKGPNSLTLVGSRVRGRTAVFATVLAMDGSEATVTSVAEDGFAACVAGKTYRFSFDGKRLDLVCGGL